MERIEFQNTQYKLREMELPAIGNVLISTTSLNRSLFNDDGSYTTEDAIFVDESIYYFVEENEIGLPNDELKTLLTIEIK